MKGSSSSSQSDFYQILQSKQSSPSSSILSVLSSSQSDKNYLKNSNTSSENLFSFDSSVVTERQNRLNESDKHYKFKKHFFVNENYDKLLEEDKKKIETNLYLEKEFLNKCDKAEYDLKNGKELTFQQIDLILYRNFAFFNEKEKRDISFIKKTYKSYMVLSLFFSFPVGFVSCAFLDKFSFYHRRKNLIRITYSFALFGSALLFITQSFKEKMFPYIIKYKDNILDSEKYFMKSPYNVNVKTFNPLSLNVHDIYKLN